jgi:hypothetical protein
VKLAFILAPFVVLLAAGVVLLVFASMSNYGDGELIFYLPLGIPGILAILAGLIGIFLVSLRR